MPQIPENFSPRDAIVIVPIASGQSLSAGNDMFGCSIVGMQIPASGWTTANVSFEISTDGVNYLSMYKSTGAADAVEYVVLGQAGSTITLPADDFAGFRWVKVRSGTSASAVNQDTVVAVTLIVRPVM